MQLVSLAEELPSHTTYYCSYLIMLRSIHHTPKIQYTTIEVNICTIYNRKRYRIVINYDTINDFFCTCSNQLYGFTSYY